MRSLSDIRPGDRTYTEQAGVRRAAAVHAFWSDDPLNRSYRQQVGETFTLRAFIAFVCEMPQEQFEACTRGGLDAR